MSPRSCSCERRSSGRPRLVLTPSLLRTSIRGSLKPVVKRNPRPASTKKLTLASSIQHVRNRSSGTKSKPPEPKPKRQIACFAPYSYRTPHAPPRFSQSMFRALGRYAFISLVAQTFARAIKVLIALASGGSPAALAGFARCAPVRGCHPPIPPAVAVGIHAPAPVAARASVPAPFPDAIRH